MWLLLGCSILALAIAVERFFQFHRARVDVGELLLGLSNLIRRKNYAEALHESAGTPGPVARVVHSAIIHKDAARPELKAIVEETGQLEVPRLERYLAVLLTIAYVAPLIGLLGTILGLVQTFIQVTAGNGFATPVELSKGVYESLITSASGLVVAIPTFILYSYLATTVRSLMHDMERAGIEVVNIIVDSRAEGSEIIAFGEAGKAAAAKGVAKGEEKKSTSTDSAS